MTPPTLLVPRGAEAAAVRRAASRAELVEIAPGSRGGELPSLSADAPIVVLGLCGALGALRVGDVVVYRSVTGERGTFACETALASALGARLVAGCTTDHVVTTRRERAALAERYRADVVDMEGTHLAAALAARGRTAAMVRVVSDDATRDLPALERAIVDGRVDGLRIALAFARAPRAAYSFVRDVRRALAALESVARAVAQG
ncbi:MAG TPA: hypothetical protein VMD91_17660 [Candidatus Sulfotelmatobacter sp.]|nr:hypothetical protein [Candidatus Sulfotelmatobacter sp.]